MGKKRPCCVPGCTDKISVRHRFPVRNEDVFNVWIKRIRNPKLQGLGKRKVYDTFLVCDRHFNDHCKNDGSKSLKIYSVPTQHLPEFHEESSKENSFLYPSYIKASNSNATKGTENVEVTGQVLMAGDDLLEPRTMNLSLDNDCHSTGSSKEHSLINDGEPKIRKFLLKEVEVSRQKELTPKARKLYTEAIKLLRHKSALTRKVKNYKTRVKLAEKFSNSTLFDNIASKVNDVTYRFFLSQLKSQKVIPKGRRFSLDDKLFALSLSKQSGKGYRLLSKYFALPSKRTLTKVLGSFHFDTGVNMNVMQHLKTTVGKLLPKDRYCSLIFDEMSLQPNIRYDENRDVIEGFQDFGNGQRKPVFADHVLVFMIRGIRKRWKQPIAYAFVEGSTKTADLVRCIKDVLTVLTETGLKIVATVCDQGSSNQAAINYLLKETDEMCKKKGIENRYFGIVVNGEEIIPLFDPPHLLKGIRNNMLTRDVLFVWEKGQQVASWKHVVEVYEIDRQNHRDDLRACPKLTEEHVSPEKIKKMKVRNCSQVFSQRVSSIMRLLAQWGNLGGRLDKSAIDTADFLLFMDKLFDSVNGTLLHPVEGKLLRSAVSVGSPHVQFWRDATTVLASLKFRNGKILTPPPSVKNWIKTLKGFIHIWDKLKGDFKFLAPRNFNQDPLENFFGSVRSHGIRNINPTCLNFKASFKSLLLNNLVSAHSVGSNCEDDDSVGPLDSLKELLRGAKHTSGSPEPPLYLHAPCEENPPSQTPLSRATKVYVTGYLARKVLKKLKGCITCRKELVSNCSVPNSEIIIVRSYSAKSLCHPNTTFSNTCNKIVNVMFSELPKMCYQVGVRKTIIDKFCRSHIRIGSCSLHDLRECVADTVVRFYLHQWCNNINRILKGKFIPKVISDPVKKAAYRKYLKSRSGKNTNCWRSKWSL